MTFFEVLLGTVIVAAVAATLLSLYSFLNATQRREQRLLACAEVANRLMLNYLDNPAAMPDSSKVVEYGPPEHPGRYRWELKEDRVAMREARPEQRDESRAGPLQRDRMRIVTIRAWLSEQSGGSRNPGADTPQVVLTRMIDPIALRNPDSAANMLSDPAAQQKWLEAMMGFSGGSRPINTAQGNAAQPAAGPATGESRARGPGGLGPRQAATRGRTSQGFAPNLVHEQWGGVTGRLPR
jgi:type II secretory pathway pseudopilin PulG